MNRRNFLGWSLGVLPVIPFVGLSPTKVAAKEGGNIHNFFANLIRFRRALYNNKLFTHSNVWNKPTKKYLFETLEGLWDISEGKIQIESLTLDTGKRWRGSSRFETPEKTREEFSYNAQVFLKYLDECWWDTTRCFKSAGGSTFKEMLRTLNENFDETGKKCIQAHLNGLYRCVQKNGGEDIKTDTGTYRERARN